MRVINTEFQALLSGFMPVDVLVVHHCGEAKVTWLDEAEAACVFSASEKRKKEFAAGRFCAREALRQVGIVGHSLTTRPDRSPNWPEGIIGSISHTEEYCIAAISSRHDLAGLGVDVELIEKMEPDIWRQILTNQEIQQLEKLPARWHQFTAAMMFSAKEALFKCVYPISKGWLDFLDVSIHIKDSTFTPEFHGACHPALKCLKLEGSWAANDRIILTSLMATQNYVSSAPWPVALSGNTSRRQPTTTDY